MTSSNNCLVIRIGVTGGRDFDSYPLVVHTLRQMPETATLVHGAARGADSLFHGTELRLVAFDATPYVCSYCRADLHYWCERDDREHDGRPCRCAADHRPSVIEELQEIEDGRSYIASEANTTPPAFRPAQLEQLAARQATAWRVLARLDGTS